MLLMDLYHGDLMGQQTTMPRGSELEQRVQKMLALEEKLREGIPTEMFALVMEYGELQAECQGIAGRDGFLRGISMGMRIMTEAEILASQNRG